MLSNAIIENKINNEIELGNFDKAWCMLNQSSTNSIKSNYFDSAFKETDNYENKILYYRVTEECDGTHIRPEFGEENYGGNGNGGGDGCCETICGLIGLIICTICCSSSYDRCCWCVLYDTICSCIEWCPCD